MFGHASADALELDLGNETVIFSSPGDFAFALGGRTDLPGPRADALLSMDERTLHDEAAKLQMQQQEFEAALGAPATQAGSIGQFFQQMDRSLITRDHEWRRIMGSLAEMDGTGETYKQIALERYVQYLAARRETVAAIQAARARSTSAARDGRTAASGHVPGQAEAGFRERPGA